MSDQGHPHVTGLTRALGETVGKLKGEITLGAADDVPVHVIDADNRVQRITHVAYEYEPFGVNIHTQPDPETQRLHDITTTQVGLPSVTITGEEAAALQAMALGGAFKNAHIDTFLAKMEDES